MNSKFPKLFKSTSKRRKKEIILLNSINIYNKSIININYQGN